MYKFKDPTLKEATRATIIDQFQHDYSSKIARFIESKIHLCKSCNGDSDSLIFLTPVQSMKLGMSILDTFHERKLKQLNQRLQSMIYQHFSNINNNDDYSIPLSKENIRQKNNHYSSNKSIRNCNELLKKYLIEQNQYRLIITRRLFKFRRKKSFHRTKNINNNNNNTDNYPRRSIEEILYHQWIQTRRRINRSTQ
jgi:hypothetical protein